MSKRFTATEKWADPWFRKLDPLQKLAWVYLCDNCDNAGVIDLDRELADFHIGGKVDWDAFISGAGQRLAILSDGKIWVTGFVKFQFGELRDNNNLHRSVTALLSKRNLNPGAPEGHLRGPRSPLVKVKVKEEEELRGGCKGEDSPENGSKSRDSSSAEFEVWWSSAPRRVGRGNASKAYAKAARELKARGEADPHGFLLERIRAFASSPKGQSGQFCPYPATWLNDARYDDDPATWEDPGGRSPPRAAAMASKPSHVFDPNAETCNDL